jgi:hypothetical protein
MNWSSSWGETKKDEVTLIELSFPQYDDEDNLIDPIKVQAFKIGDLAVHVSSTVLHWRITHIPTLTKFDKALPEQLPGQRFSCKMLIAWCCKVQEQELSAWNVLREATNDTYQEDCFKDAKETIFNICGLVEVE